MKKILKVCLLITAALIAVPKTYAQISIGISISANIAPPALPVYVQPACPTDGYLWVPGYWAYDNDSGDYYWVPGVWVAPPNPGLLWTPAYWGYSGGSYGFHPGYWGPHVGFYGGINYGFGYGGIGFVGGQWSGNSFRYNTAVVNVNRTVIHNTYIDRTVIVNNTIVNNHTSFNGPGGVAAKPRPEELAAMKERHVQPTGEQLSHESTARSDKGQHTSQNKGRPAAVAMDKVGGARFTPQGKPAPHVTKAVAARPNAAARPANVNKPAMQAEKPERTKAAAPEKTEHAAPKPAYEAAKPAAKQAQPRVQQRTPQQHVQQRAPQQHVQQHVQAAPKAQPKEEKRHE